MIASFSCIHILLGNVVTQLMFGGIFNNNIIANCPYNVPVKNFENWLIFSKDIDKNKVACFYGPRCTTISPAQCKGRARLCNLRNLSG